MEARKYGFTMVDFLRLINALVDFSSDFHGEGKEAAPQANPASRGDFDVSIFPLQSDRLSIRIAEGSDLQLLVDWIHDEYGVHFLLSSTTAQALEIGALMQNTANKVGIVELKNGKPIGAVAFLDIDNRQRRAELRKLIGEKSARGQGYAEEATALWMEYGSQRLGLEKIYVSTLQTHIRNIRLNESVGFRVEGVLRDEVLIDSQRHDVLRMGYCAHARNDETTA